MADIVLKDRNGNDIQYPGVERLKLNTVDGEPVEFVDPALMPELLEDIPIALDFSEGDQLIEAPEGMAVKTATLLKPETLVPENIAEGIDIAGIVGTLAAGGGGGVQVFAKSVTASATTNNTRVSVDFGFTPDFILVFQNATITSSSSRSYPIFACGFTTTAAAALSVTSAQYYATTQGSTGTNTSNTSWNVDTTTDWPAGIRCVDATGFNLSNRPWYSTSLYVIAFKLT